MQQFTIANVQIFKRKCKNVILMIVACIILTVFLQEISNTIKYSMFSDPNDLQEWDDHIQIVMVLKGSFKKHSLLDNAPN